MKKLLIAVLGIMVLAGCRPTVPPAPIPPGEVVVVPNEEKAETAKIEAQAVKLVEAGKFDELEKLAGRLRQPKFAWLSGYWPIVPLYRGLALVPSGAPESAW